MELRRFHYSFCVRDLDEARQFYGGLLGAKEGRSAETWVDFDFFGNQLSCHRGAAAPTARVGIVDGIKVPMPHFGAIITWPEYEQLSAKLTAAKIEFVVTPRIRYPGEVGEQGTFFLIDPSGNALEFKAFRRPDEVFAR